MAISQNEASKLVKYLESQTRKCAIEAEADDLTELLDQWRADVEAGKPKEQRLSVRESPGIDAIAEVPRSRRKTSGDFIGREEYSDHEQLEMLIAALGVVFIAPSAMARTFMQEVRSASEGSDTVSKDHIEIQFVDPIAPEEEEFDRQISEKTIRQSAIATQKLARLLQEITEVAELRPLNFMLATELD